MTTWSPDVRTQKPLTDPSLGQDMSQSGRFPENELADSQQVFLDWTWTGKQIEGEFTEDPVQAPTLVDCRTLS